MKIRPEGAEFFRARRTDMTKLNAKEPTNSFTGSQVVAREQTTRHGDVNRCIIAGFLAKVHGFHSGGTRQDREMSVSHTYF